MLCTKDSWITDWEKHKLIARGSHSDVLEITHKKNTERRAAKFIRLPMQLGEENQPAAHKKLMEVLENEKQLCKMEHNNIVKFLDISLLEKEPSVVVSMEMIEGETLDVFVNTNKPLADNIVTNLAKQICNALWYLHTFKPRAIIHRDINCRTIMVCDGNAIKLIDFGLAVQLVESATDHVTGNPKGDPAFMAPELFLSDETEDTPYSCASDIWAFGCVIYQMVTGNRPHSDCKNMLAIVRRVKNKGAPDLPVSSSDTLNDFYTCCTAKDKYKRMPAADLLKHPFLHGRAIAGSSEPPSQPEKQQEKEDKRALPLDTSSSDHDTYKMTAPVTGLCLVINIEEYTESSGFSVKQNHQKEIKGIKDTFEKLGFTVEVKSNLKCENFWRIVDHVVTSLDLLDMGSFVCFILGHGTGGSFMASDREEVEVRDIVARFRASQCSSLKGKPKVFFIQTEKQTEGSEACSLEDTSFCLPENDFLLCSGGSTGSLADAVCTVIQDEKFRKEHIEIVVAEVNKRLKLPVLKKGAERFGSGSSAVTSLTKKFHLDRTDTADYLPQSPDQWSDQQLLDQSNSPEKSQNTFGPLNQTPLMVASIKGKSALVNEMLKYSLRVDVQDAQGRTALCWAALKGHIDVLAEFKKAFENNPSALKMEVNICDNLRQTPLILAAKNNRTNVLELLVEMGAQVDCQDAMKCSAITYAAKLGFEETVRKLCDLDANLKLADFSNNSPLIWAARCGHENVLKVLGKRLDKPSDLDYWKSKGERQLNAQEWAKYCEHIKCASIVEKCIRQLTNQSTGPVNFEQSGNGNNDPGSGGSGSGGGSEDSNAGREEGATGGGGPPNDSPGGQQDSVQGGPYPMHGIHRGIALVVNIHDFVGLNLQRRQGSMVDMSEDALYGCFTTLGFDCRMVQNVNRRFFDGLPTNICTEEELTTSKAIIVCLMSHGGKGFIFAHDGSKVAHELIYTRFQCCPQLKDKPKLFFIQACREEAFTLQRPEPAAPLEDCLYFYSTSLGRTSIRDSVKGGVFSQVLCSVVTRHFQPDTEEFTAIVPRVIRGVFDLSNGQQVPCCELSILRPLHFPTLGMRDRNTP